jgi:hypothetical protein
LAIDFSNDPNVVRNVVIADGLTTNAIWLDADPLPDRKDDQFIWNLGDVPPLGTITATLRLQVPGTVVDFTDLDTGATAYGTLQGRSVSASTAPATLAPESFAQWLVWTVDADYYDEYAMQKAAELGNDWEQIFSYVRSLGYESYKGSLRGTRGTLWSEAGNSVDQASLLVAMLRGNGVPARYRHGTLSTAHAQELILSMFPVPQWVIGHIPERAEVADPANDPQLLEETVDHWWAEAYLPGLGWTNLDPCFATAIPSQTFYDALVTDGTDQIAELPDDLRHKVTMTLKVEQAASLTALIPDGFDITYPLSHTFNTVELVGNPVTLSHLVNSDFQSGAVFWNMQHTYVPYFSIDGFTSIVEGQPFQDLMSNFSFGNFIVTGEWLLFDVQAPDGNVEHYEREIVDTLGFEVRRQGGTVESSRESVAPLFTPLDSLSVLVTVGNVPHSTVYRYYLSLQPVYQDMAAMYDIAVALEREASMTQSEIDDVKRMIGTIQSSIKGENAITALAYASASYQTATNVGRSLLMRGYLDHPNILLASADLQKINGTFGHVSSLDLLHSNYRVISSPEQTIAAQSLARFLIGLFASTIESIVLEEVTGRDVVSTVNIFQKAIEENIEFHALSIENISLLDQLAISDQAKARILQNVEQGYIIVLPGEMISIADSQTIGWFRIDPSSGETIGLLENGHHGVRSAPLCSDFVEVGFSDYFFVIWAGASFFMMGFIGQFIITILSQFLTGHKGCN